MSEWVLPILIAAVVCWGLLRGTPVYDSFVRGAGKGVQTSLSVLPALAAIMVAVEMMKASGALELLCGLLAKPLEFIGFPADAAPLATATSPDAIAPRPRPVWWTTRTSSSNAWVREHPRSPMRMPTALSMT